jgi:hypothetical protein
MTLPGKLERPILRYGILGGLPISEERLSRVSSRSSWSTGRPGRLGGSICFEEPAGALRVRSQGSGYAG